MTRRAPLALLALVLAGACSDEKPESCPGEEIGFLDFVGSVATARLPEGLDPEPDWPDCGPALRARALHFGGTLAAGTRSAALCRTSGTNFFGTHTDRSFVMEASSTGAVLAVCGTTCGARSRTVISGDVLPDLASPQEFRGALVEQFSRSEGACDACDLPCAVRYELVGTVEPP